VLRSTRFVCRFWVPRGTCRKRKHRLAAVLIKAAIVDVFLT
jgi:hypothetical protein